MLYSGGVGNAVINELRKKRMQRHGADQGWAALTNEKMPKIGSGVMRSLPGVSVGTKKGKGYAKFTPGKG